MMVVFHHTRNEIGGAMSIQVGARGVEIFFVISGLVMMLTTHGVNRRLGATLAERWAQTVLFWKKRFVRVAPLYWIAMLFAAPLVAHVSLGDWVLLQDAMFIPHWSKTHPGEIWPTLVPGWTLNYEMFFYLIFGLSFFFGKSSVWFTGAVIVLLSVARNWTVSDAIALRFYTNPVMLNFLAGMLLYFLLGALQRRPALVPPKWLLVAGLIAGFVGLGFAPQWAGVGWYPLVCSVIVTAAVFLFEGVELRTLHLLGDASYSVYLFHLLSLAMTHKLLAWVGLSVATKLGVLTAFATYMTVAAICGVIIHLLVEKSLNRGVAQLIGIKPK
jgi:exopolysaccharide production protein ExoZ